MRETAPPPEPFPIPLASMPASKTFPTTDMTNTVFFSNQLVGLLGCWLTHAGCAAALHRTLVALLTRLLCLLGDKLLVVGGVLTALGGPLDALGSKTTLALKHHWGDQTLDLDITQSCSGQKMLTKSQKHTEKKNSNSTNKEHNQTNKMC